MRLHNTQSAEEKNILLEDFLLRNSLSTTSSDHFTALQPQRRHVRLGIIVHWGSTVTLVPLKSLRTAHLLFPPWGEPQGDDLCTSTHNILFEYHNASRRACINLRQTLRLFQGLWFGTLPATPLLVDDCEVACTVAATVLEDAVLCIKLQRLECSALL